MTPQEILVHNERTKLLANAFDRASTAALVVGVFGPLASTVYSADGSPPAPLPTLGFFTIFAMLIAVWLHLLARWTLRGLK